MTIMTTQLQYITDANGDKVSVILSLEDYQELLEDLEDLAAIAERRDEPTQDFEDALKEIACGVHD